MKKTKEVLYRVCVYTTAGRVLEWGRPADGVRKIIREACTPDQLLRGDNGLHEIYVPTHAVDHVEVTPPLPLKEGI